MWEASYGKEPFDLRLTVLRMMSQWRGILVCVLVGTLFLGGSYCLKNLVFGGETQYAAKSTYRVDYSVEDEDLGQAYINDYTWNVYVQTEEFLNHVKGYLQEGEWAALGIEELKSLIRGQLDSDWRVPSTVVTTENPQKSEAIARAVEETMVNDFPQGISEIASMRVIDSGRAAEVIPDVRVARAFILAAVFSVFAALVFFLLKETGDSGIWLPASVGRRYGVRAAGTIESRELAQNISYMFADRKRVAVCTVQEDIEPMEIAAALKKVCEAAAVQKEFIALPSPVICPESAEELRKAEGILLAVKAGGHAGRQLEYVLEYLGQQDCKVTAVLLWDADEKLLKNYYRFKRNGKQTP